jgi:CBS domain containing-hemolysin-like protein
MKARVAISAINKKTSFTEALEIIVGSGYSRITVFEEEIDKVVGILYIKDLIPHLNEKDNFNWAKLCRAPYFVPETKMINDLLKEFQAKKNHLAIVVDEYGGTAGLVTLEDVLEEIVGEIDDEFDADDLSYSKIDANNYIFDGKITIKDFCKVLEDTSEEKFEEHKGESETIAGFILEISGKFPKIGEKITFDIYTFTIEAIDRKRIRQLKVTRQHV